MACPVIAHPVVDHCLLIWCVPLNIFGSHMSRYKSKEVDDRDWAIHPVDQAEERWWPLSLITRMGGAFHPLQGAQAVHLSASRLAIPRTVCYAATLGVPPQSA
jgi:hypothetical protein